MVEIQSPADMSLRVRFSHYLKMLLGHCQVEPAFTGPLEATDIKFSLKVHVKKSL